MGLFGKVFGDDNNSWIKLYQKMSGSDLKGNIANRIIIETLYAMLCVDTSSKECKISVPDISIPVIAREVIDVYHTLKDFCIDGEDYSCLSMETISDAMLLYLAMSHLDMKDIHSMSRYELAQQLIHIVDEDETGVE